MAKIPWIYSKCDRQFLKKSLFEFLELFITFYNICKLCLVVFIKLGTSHNVLTHFIIRLFVIADFFTLGPTHLLLISFFLLLTFLITFVFPHFIAASTSIKLISLSSLAQILLLVIGVGVRRFHF